MSTFGGLSTAYSGLVAARAGLDLVGQNIANAGTEGYTRQRITQSSIGGVAQTGALKFTAGAGQVGQGVAVDGIARLGNLTLDAQVRGTQAASSWSTARSDALSSLETSLNEPGTDGLSARLDQFWSSWQDLANNAGDAAPAGVVLNDAEQVAATLASGSRAVDAQWTTARQSVDTMTAQLNDAASQVAALNGQIRSTTAAGGSVNELVDKRAVLTEKIASLAGGTVRDNGDGTVDVVLGGNALVSGTSARTVVATGSHTMAGAAASPVSIAWADRPGTPIGLDGGSIAGTVSVLAPADANGTGGVLAETSAGYDRVATALAAQVNQIQAGGYTSTGATGTAFFTFTAGVPAAQGLTVVPNDASGLATRNADGAIDGSYADAISQLGGAAGAPDRIWSGVVTGVGAASAGAQNETTLTGLAATSAKTQQQSGAGVDLDEENVDLLTYQHAYQGAARVLTAVDEMLDTLINHVGLVGRS